MLQFELQAEPEPETYPAYPAYIDLDDSTVVAWQSLWHQLKSDEGGFEGAGASAAAAAATADSSGAAAARGQQVGFLTPPCAQFTP